MQAKSPSHADIVRLFGRIDDHRVAEILALEPTLEELEEVAAYLVGATDVMGEERHPLSGHVASIYEIVMRDELQDDDRSH